ncbi:DUF637 domain-containing protein [Photorhabdus tasmaniensis]|uniref:DUF637 domain-containing protein n=1 Tax=Photorhabdus tasmaniensis TaxID=1004159 RepID=UPI004041CFC2
MEQRNNSMVRVTSYLLIYLTAVYPLHPAIAAGITPDNSQIQVQNQGNIPVVNIATPNDAGISHNTYQEFNVATQGAVLNNATQAAQSQLAGQLNANPNLKDKAAELIINEVTGNGRSELQGQLEIVGNKANVMIANPNGITCDGCGFINTASATLTTGKPQFDKQGALEALEVKQGQITIGSKGLDGKATDYVDIISRATELNGKIQANTLSLTQGANRISLKDGTVNSLAGEGAKPQLAIDTKALGGMYANKIRLVATEDGVGVNLKELTSDQRDITLNANGKIELGNTNAKTDLNIIGKETHIAPNITVQAKRDMTLANTTLENKGRVTAGRDMRVFGDTVRNTGDKALLQANDNLWIQKDAQGNRGQLVENRSATIKTVKGDLVVRTKDLNNTRNVFVMQNKPVTPDFTDRDMTVFNDVNIFGKPYAITAELTPLPDKWFGHAYFSRLSFEDNRTEKAYLNNARMKSRVLENSLPGLILSGRNAYINSDNLSNQISKIAAEKDIFLTGNKLINESKRKSSLNDFIIYDLKLEPAPTVYPYKKSGETQTLNDEDDVIEPASLIAKGSIVADFKDSITINTALPYDIKTVSEINVKERPETLSAKNIILHAGQINITDKIKAINELNIIAEKEINLNDAALLSSNNLSMTAINNINALQSEVKGQEITLISRHGDVRFQSSEKPGYFNADNTRRVSTLSAKGNLTINAGKNLLLQNTYLTPSTYISLTANNDIGIENTVRLTPRQTGPVHSDKWDPDLLNAILPEQEKGHLEFLLPMTGVLHASTSLMINAGGHFFTQGAFISAGKDVYLSAAKHIELGSRELIFHKLEGIFLSSYYIPPSRSLVLGSRITAKNNISLISGGDINGKAVQIQASGNTLLSAGRNITLPALAYSAINQANDNNKDDRHIIAQVRGDKKLTMAANGAITTAGTQLTSDGDVTLSSGGNLRFESVQNHIYRENGREFTKSVSQQGTELTSGGILTLISNGSILFQTTKLAAKGAMDVAAQGGYLYAQAMEESSHYEKTETKRRWYGRKKTTTRTRHDVTNKVTEFTAGGDINLLSRDDSTYEASKITTNQHAKLTSTHGQVNFKAVKNSTFAQTITHSKGFYITQTDKGYTENTWVLPAIHLGGKLTVEAANGVSADIKAKNGQSLHNALSVFGNTPETAWLKGLSERQDVQWSLVNDAYDSWDYKSQHLNPVVSAVIAIAVATVTAGAGITASVAGSAAGTAGSAATAAGATASTAATVGSMAYGATASGMAALASQAAVTLVDNQGDLSKTLKAMGSSDTVKSIFTSMAMGGALAGFDTVMGWDNAANGAKLDPSKATLPSLSNGDWSKVAQRVAGQSIIGASLGTTINGGSFKDNFTTALLSNIGSQMNAEGANLIGNNGQILGVPGKAISHAAVSALAAEIGGGNAKGAAAGALAAELAAITLDKTFSDPMSIQAGGKIIGGVAGAIATNSAAGANSGASAGEIVIVYNSLAHLLSAAEKERRGTIKAYEEKKRAFCQQSPEACKQAGEIISFGTDFVPVIGDIKGFVEAESALDYLVAAIAIIPGAGDAAGKTIKAAEKALKNGDVGKASKLINKVSDEISAYNSATYPKLKHNLAKQNLHNIASQDSRLAAAIKGDNGKVNFGIGNGSREEADRLGKIWVGDGARPISDGTGLVSADGTRIYRFPTEKKNSKHASTGTQANFETFKINPSTSDKIKIGNGHLDIQ